MNLQVTPRTTDSHVPVREGSSRPLRAAIGVVVIAGILGGYYLYTHMAGNSGRVPRNVTAPVRVATVHQRNMAVIERTIGTVVANSVVSVTARVQGQLISVHFKEGQLVRKGDLLSQIDPA